MEPIAHAKNPNQLPAAWQALAGVSLFPWNGVWPVLAPDVALAAGARIIGQVELAAGVSVWFNAVIRADINTITIGAQTNVQDNATLHVSHGEGCLIIGSQVVIGHGALVHACKIADRVLIGMGAIILDGAEIGEETIIAAGAVVPPRMTIPSGVLVAGVPSKIVRNLSPDERNSIAESALQYQKNAKLLKAALDFRQ